MPAATPMPNGSVRSHVARLALVPNALERQVHIVRRSVLAVPNRPEPLKRDLHEVERTEVKSVVRADEGLNRPASSDRMTGAITSCHRRKLYRRSGRGKEAGASAIGAGVE